MKKKMFFPIILSFIVVLLVFSMIVKKYGNSEIILQNGNNLALDNSKQMNNDFAYLSDIKTLSSSVGYGSLGIDVSTSGNNISLLVDGQVKYFIKGIAAHAKSTLVYDLKDYDYDMFSAYLGIDYSVVGNTSTDGVKFKISVSNDNATWTEMYISDKFYKATMNADFVQIDIKDVKYLKLEALHGGNIWNDYATYANAKLTKEGYIEEVKPATFFKTIAEYDQIITNYTIDESIELYELALLQRTFVKNVGYDMLQALCQYSNDYEETLKWLMNDKNNLKLFLTGGKPDGAYTTSVKHLTNLYIKHKEDLNDNTIDSVSHIRNGEVYKKMMISLSLTHARNIGFWMNESQKSDAVVRYEVFKDLRINGKLENNIFDDLSIMNMRLVFNSLISDEQISWLNYYSRLKGSLNPYSYITYRDDYNYLEEQYYSAENYNKWDAKYNLSEYKIPYVSGQQKIWIMFEEGAVCGGLSKTGTNLNTSRGIPALVLGQPGHAAYMVYSKNADGLGKWDLGNDVSGWAESNWTYEGTFPTGWGTESWAGNHSASATLLSQAALNDLSNFEKAEKYIYLANVYKDKNPKDYITLEKIYNKALDVQIINYDAWKALVNLYKVDSSKTEADFLVLAQRISTALTYYPFPMFYLVQQLDMNIKSDGGIAALTLIKNETLNKATSATTNDTVQPDVAINLSKYLLGKNDLSIASFSFDGINAGKIILSPRFNESETRLKYSLDAGTTWTETSDKYVTLTKEQLDSINVSNDILVGLVGCNTNQVINITQANTPTNLYNNDLENRVIGVTNSMEWSFDQITWTSFNTNSPNLEGKVTVYVRISSNGTEKTSLPVSLNYMKDVINLNEMYIPIKHLSIAEASSYQGGAEPIKAIDGNANTMWHSNWNNSLDTKKFITIKLDEPMYISALQYIPRSGGGNGNIRSGKVFVSADGTNWEEVAAFSNLANNGTPKKIILKNNSLVSYVKLVGIDTINNNISAAMINLFKDDTLLPKAQLDDYEGIYDLYHKAQDHCDLKFNIIKNSEIIKEVLFNNKLYNLENTENLEELSQYLNIVPSDSGYQMTILSSWLSSLSNGNYSIVFVTNKENHLNYGVKVVDTYMETNYFESDDKFGSIIVDQKVDATYKLKIEKLENVGEDISKFKNYLIDKEVFGNYDISIYDETKKVSYDQSVFITLNVGKNLANQKIKILHEKNGKIEIYFVIVNKNGKAIFRSLSGLSQFVVLIDKKKIELDQEKSDNNFSNSIDTDVNKKPDNNESNSESSNGNNSNSNSNSNSDKNGVEEKVTIIQKRNTIVIILTIIASLGTIIIAIYQIIKFKKK